METLPIALITGASGGMGQACARILGHRFRLAITDISSERIEPLAEQLNAEGYHVAVRHHGDLAQPDTVASLLGGVREAGALRAVAHTAGMSPALGDWDIILRANLVATERLLRGIEEGLESGLALVLIASMAGHRAPVDAALDELFAAPLDPALLTLAKPLLARHVAEGDRYGLASPAYATTKRANLRTVQARASAWARRGNRIVSISPGTIRTPMGLAEAASNPAAKVVVDATPMGRWGTAIDIAALADFLLSDRAGFITGTDVLCDGGVSAAFKFG